jgi:carbamoyl-phosphate synthase large subunit
MTALSGTDRTTPAVTVVVTGAGGPLGVSVFKALRMSSLDTRIVATDADPMSVGLFRADGAYVLPRVADDPEAYMRQLETLCRDEGAAMVFFGSEVEMRYMAPVAQEMEQRSGAKLIVNDPELVDGFLDKWTTNSLLRDRGLPVPESILVSDSASHRPFAERHGFPLVLKPRRGSGSQNVFVLRSIAELERLAQQVPDGVIQEYLLPDDEEYTIGAYRSRARGYVGQIQLKRVLGAGLTYKADVVRDPEIGSACRRMVEAFDFWGPVNLQLRKTDAGVRIFEVNLRCSSTTVIRAHFGFNEPEMCIRDELWHEPLDEPAVRMGRVLRYWDEVYVDAADLEGASGPPDFPTIPSRKTDVF